MMKIPQKGGIDLTPLIDLKNSTPGKYAKLWAKVEEVAVRGLMLPKKKKKLTENDKLTIAK